MGIKCWIKFCHSVGLNFAVQCKSLRFLRVLVIVIFLFSLLDISLPTFGIVFLFGWHCSTDLLIS